MGSKNLYEFLSEARKVVSAEIADLTQRMALIDRLIQVEGNGAMPRGRKRKASSPRASFPGMGRWLYEELRQMPQQQANTADLVERVIQHYQPGLAKNEVTWRVASVLYHSRTRFVRVGRGRWQAKAA